MKVEEAIELLEECLKTKFFCDDGQSFHADLKEIIQQLQKENLDLKSKLEKYNIWKTKYDGHDFIDWKDLLLNKLKPQEIDDLMYKVQIYEFMPQQKQFVLAQIPYRFLQYYKSKYDWKEVTEKTNFYNSAIVLNEDWKFILESEALESLKENK